MVNAKTGEAIEVPDLDPSRGVYLVFSDPDTAVGCSPERGALTVYEPPAECAPGAFGAFIGGTPGRARRLRTHRAHPAWRILAPAATLAP